MAPSYRQAVELVEAYVSLAHGNAALLCDRAFGDRLEGVDDRASEAARRLVTGYATAAAGA